MAGRQAIIDVGSNSVRLVVYSGTPRVPSPIFNEKVMAGLGKSVGETGELSAESSERALAALRRFRILTREMKVSRTLLVATAAVREASNGSAFVKNIERIGFDCEVLSGKEEGVLAGEGVLSGICDAKGVVADLGGGSLELVEVANGKTGSAISLPLGVLRLAAARSTEPQVSDQLRSALRDTPVAEAARGNCLYLVGGSWRALARLDMAARSYPLPVTHQYSIAPARAAELRELAKAPEPRWSKGIGEQRLAAAPAAAMLLSALVGALRPQALTVSTFGIREGLLYSRLDRKTRALDPLIEAARDAGEAERRFGPHGDVLDDWIEGIFDDQPEMRRLRLAACLLADVSWHASAPFRADRAVEMALHGNWVGIDPPGRIIVAQALSSSFGSNKLVDESLARLCQPEDLQRARLWGLAIRLGQRFSAGVAAALEGSSLQSNDRGIELRVSRPKQALVGEAVLRRLDQLAGALGTKGRAIIS